MTRCRALTSVAVLCVFVAAPLCAQIPTRRPPIDSAPRLYSIRGTLRSGADETAIPNIKVELRRFSGEVVGLSFTRSNGDFEFGGLPTGEYILNVDEEGYEPVREKVEILQSARIGVQIYLRKPIRVSQRSDGPTVSTRELTLPRKARESLNKGRQQLFERRNPAGSVPHFRRTLAEAPDYYEAMHLLGIALMDMGQLAEAEQALRQSIAASNGRFAEPHFALAALLSTNQQYADAEASARAGMAIDGAAWLGPFELARAMLGSNQLEGAESQLQIVRQRNPGFAPMYLLSINVNLRKKDAAAVLRDLDEYLKLEPQGPMAQRAREMRETLLGPQSQARANPPKP